MGKTSFIKRVINRTPLKRMRQKNIFRFKQFTIDQTHAAQKVGTDSDLLGALGAGGNAILDIGTGTGVLALMMAQRFPEARITAVEIDDDAVIDAQQNFASSPFADRITLVHSSFQDFCASKLPAIIDSDSTFSAIICNPPYFDKSLESNNISRTRARHTSSLPFRTLISGAYTLLAHGGTFSVCIPPEVLTEFSAECLITGFMLQDCYRIKSVPEHDAKRYILVYKKGNVDTVREYEYCMRNSDRTYSDWYHTLMRDFLL